MWTDWVHSGFGQENAGEGDGFEKPLVAGQHAGAKSAQRIAERSAETPAQQLGGRNAHVETHASCFAFKIREIDIVVRTSVLHAPDGAPSHAEAIGEGRKFLEHQNPPPGFQHAVALFEGSLFVRRVVVGRVEDNVIDRPRSEGQTRHALQYSIKIDTVGRQKIYTSKISS